MANNPYVNKVVYGNQTVMDISDSDVTEDDVVNGKTFYKASGARSTGSAVIPDISNCYETTDAFATYIDENTLVPINILNQGKRKVSLGSIIEVAKSRFDQIYGTVTEALLKFTVGWISKNLANPNDLELGVSIRGESSPSKARLIVPCKSEKTYIISAFGQSNLNIQFAQLPSKTDIPIVTLSLSVNSAGQGIETSSTTNFLFFEFTSSSTYTKEEFLAKQFMVREGIYYNDTYEPYHSSVKQTLRDYEVIEGKNLLHTNSVTTTTGGVTFTVNRNAQGEVTSIDISGASGNEDVYFNLKDKTSEYASGDYIYSDDVANENIGIVAEGYNGSTWVTNFGGTSFTGEKSFTIDYSNYDSISLLIRVKANTTLSNTVRIYPMLRYASESDDAYEPYYIPLKDSKFDRAEQGILGAKNLLPNNASTQTINGVTFTVNADGSVTANGTASADAELTVNTDVSTIKSGDYILTGCPSGGSSSTYHQMLIKSPSPSLVDSGNGVNVTIGGSYTVYQLKIRVLSGQTVSNLLFKPMLRLASDPDNTYVPYAMTNKELTDGLGAVRITLSKAEYDALSSAEKNDPDKVYYVYDDTSDGNFYYLERSDITVSNIDTAVRIPASGSDPNIHTTSNVVSIVSDSGAGWRTITINEGYVEVLVSKTFTSKAIGIYVDNR